jgi:hypothetical protein
MRHVASAPPTTIPRSFTAVIAYSEHVGKNRQLGPRLSGEIAAR